jgi:hypothetical protein
VDPQKLLKKAVSGLDQLSDERYADRVAALPEPLRAIVDCFIAGLPLDEIIDQTAVKLHEPRPGPPNDSDFRRARLELVHQVREIRNRLEL